MKIIFNSEEKTIKMIMNKNELYIPGCWYVDGHKITNGLNNENPKS